MQSFEKFLTNNPGKVFFILLVLAAPAFFINLGLLPLFADEPTRANVALEMIISKNFAVPTIGGEFYYNKPPLYNWILTSFYQIAGSYSEFITRLPAATPLFLFAVSIYISASYFLKNKQAAALSGLLFLVNGRMLIYDSMLGHIDIFYSWLTYLSFMSIFYFYQKGQWFQLFFISYTLTALTFLAKGLPSIVFQGFTLITLVAYTKNWRQFFSWKHIISGLFCLLIIASYFYNYSRYNPKLSGYLETIWNQSSQRTAAEYSIWENIRHIILFPFEHLGHLFPASLLVLFCLHKNFWKWLKGNPFLTYTALIFIANIWVYWLSPQTRPRYLLMLYPLLLMIWAHAYFEFRNSLPKINRIFNTALIVLTVSVTLAFPASYYFDLPFIPSLNIKILLLFSLGCVLSYLIIVSKQHKIFVFTGLLILVRLGFSWLILPERLSHSQDNYYKTAAIEMGRSAGKTAFYFYQYTPPILEIPFHDRLIFYIERERMKLVKFTASDAMPGYYLTFDRDLKNPKAVLVKSYQSNLKLYLVK